MTHPVYLVDDDEAVRDALTLLLSTVGLDVAPFADPQAFLARLDGLAPGCLILDIRMPLISGLKLQEKLIERNIDWPTVVISGHGDIEACRQAFRNGAVDFLSKPIDEQDLIDAIQKGNEILERRLLAEAEKAEARSLLQSLTPREGQVLDRIAEGFTSKQIAEGLGLSPRTIESHRAAIGAKLGTTSQAELTRLWLEGRDSP
ncbi:response regulator transcription factor [Leisingera aquaemixtae]|uniref:response regulator transcription factor n=1 Tax=Leisingera aquaemixtae TaxID=1396826 RepID=UPI0021A8A38A|nr:response regulator transcription factor [Leisingera aquaemixtae]UWQ24080.1 response regulator transcription factor [Leisingera aquaemixtae]UWQ44958.1 response regulator transcription factor [Leisingera aquaemixtae]